MRRLGWERWWQGGRISVRWGKRMKMRRNGAAAIGWLSATFFSFVEGVCRPGEGRVVGVKHENSWPWITGTGVAAERDQARPAEMVPWFFAVAVLAEAPGPLRCGTWGSRPVVASVIFWFGPFGFLRLFV